MIGPVGPKIRIFGLDGLKNVGSKRFKVKNRKLKKKINGPKIIEIYLLRIIKSFRFLKFFLIKLLYFSKFGIFMNFTS